MSDALRELFVAIDFKEVDISRLDRVDRKVDGIEKGFRELGADIRRVGSITDSEIGGAVRDVARLDSHVSELGDEFRETGKDADKAMDEIAAGADKAKKAVDEVGEAGKKSGKKGKDGMEEFLGKVQEVLPDSRIAGEASKLFSNPWVLAGAAVVGAVVGVTAALAAMANATDKAMDRIKAMTGEQGADLKALQDTARGVYRDGFGESLTEVGDDVAKLHGQFKDLDAAKLESLTEGAYTLKELFGPEVKETSKSVKALTTNFQGLQQSDALDLITFAFQKGGDYADDLLDTLNEYSVHFAKLGIDAKGFVGTLLKGSEAGAFNLDKVGDSVKEFGIRAVDGSATTADGFKKLGFSVKDMSAKIAAGGDTAQNAFMATVAALSFVGDKVKQNQIGVELFGTQWEDVKGKVIFAMDGAEKAVDGFRGSTKQAGDDLQDNFGSKWEKVKRGFKDGLSNVFGGGSGGVGSDILDGILTHMPEIQQGVRDVGKWFGEVFGGNGTIGQAISGFGDAWSGIWSAVEGIWNVAGPFLKASVGGTFEVIFATIGNTLTVIGDVFRVFGDVLKGDWGQAWEDVKKLFNDSMSGVIEIAHAGLDLLFGSWDSTIGRIIELVTGIDLTKTGENIITGLINGMGNMKDWVIQKVTDLGGDILDSLKGFFHIKSPSRVMMEMGGYISQGFGIGIEDEANKPVRAARNMSTDVLGAVAAPAAATTPSSPQMAPIQAAAQQSATQGTPGPSIALTMPAMTFQIQGNVTREDARSIGDEVQKRVNETVAAIFQQLGMKLALD
jgi:phage-related minor tail protein